MIHFHHVKQMKYRLCDPVQARELSEPDLDTCKMPRVIVTLEYSWEKSMWWPRQRVGCGRGVTQICYPSLPQSLTLDPAFFFFITWCFQMTVIWSSCDQSPCGGVSKYHGSSKKRGKEGEIECLWERAFIWEAQERLLEETAFGMSLEQQIVFWQITRFKYQDAIAVRRNRAVR